MLPCFAGVLVDSRGARIPTSGASAPPLVRKLREMYLPSAAAAVCLDPIAVGSLADARLLQRYPAPRYIEAATFLRAGVRQNLITLEEESRH